MPASVSCVGARAPHALPATVPALKAALLLGQLPSHRANAARTLDFLGVDATGEDFMARYRGWEADYEAYLAAVSGGNDIPAGQGATLLAGEGARA
jgi:hypothetical protein